MFKEIVLVRRTKEEAQETRHKLLDAAEHLFQEQGVSRTSLQDIAKRAGATRGAIYWHFKDKADLFNAMMERVTLPLEERVHRASFTPEGVPDISDPMSEIRQATDHCLSQLVNDPQTRRVIEVATQKVEYVEELRAVRLRHLSVRDGFLARFEHSIEAAAKLRGLTLPISTECAAQGFHALMDGVIQNWLLDPQAFDLQDVGRSVITVYLSGLGFTAQPVKAPKPTPTE
jgi:TetR/AcrR family acrAB operon transcriptional repressor